jgi:hypothetical protein
MLIAKDFGLSMPAAQFAFLFSMGVLLISTWLLFRLRPPLFVVTAVLGLGLPLLALLVVGGPLLSSNTNMSRNFNR